MTAVLNNVPVPAADPIAAKKRREFFGQGEREDPQEGLITEHWREYFDQSGRLQEQAPSRIGQTTLTDQAANISATDISGGNLSSGLYRFTYYTRITRAAGVSSSLTVTLSWTDGGIACSFSGAAITANTTSTTQSETKLLRIDSVSPVSYSTAYASAGAPTMQYRLDVALEEIWA